MRKARRYEQLRASIEEFIEEYYNRHGCTLRWATDPREEFERKAEDQGESRGARMESAKKPPKAHFSLRKILQHNAEREALL